VFDRGNRRPHAYRISSAGEKRRNTKKAGYRGNSKGNGIMKTDEKRMEEDEKKKERAMMEEGLYITAKEV
jgi:hypothetical protein